MQLSHFNRLALVGALVLVVLVSHVSAQEQAPPWKPGEQIGVGLETYNQVLNILFPRDALENPGRSVFVLRYLPSFDAESQFTIVEKDGVGEVVEYVSLDGNILQKLHEIYQRIKREDAAEMAKQMRVRRRVLKISIADFKRLSESFFTAACAMADYERRQNPDNSLTETDGTIYQVWYRAANTTHFDVGGADIDSTPEPGEAPLIGWMREVRLVVNKPTTARVRRN